MIVVEEKHDWELSGQHLPPAHIQWQVLAPEKEISAYISGFVRHPCEIALCETRDGAEVQYRLSGDIVRALISLEDGTWYVECLIQHDDFTTIRIY